MNANNKTRVRRGDVEKEKRMSGMECRRGNDGAEEEGANEWENGAETKRNIKTVVLPAEDGEEVLARERPTGPPRCPNCPPPPALPRPPHALPSDPVQSSERRVMRRWMDGATRPQGLTYPVATAVTYNFPCKTNQSNEGQSQEGTVVTCNTKSTPTTIDQ